MRRDDDDDRQNVTLHSTLHMHMAMVSVALLLIGLSLSHAFVLPLRRATSSVSRTAQNALPPEQGIPVLAGILAYPTLLIYRNLSGGALPVGEEAATEEAAPDLAGDGGSIGRSLKWSKMQEDNPSSPPYVRMCVGQDCTKDGAVEAWDMVRDMAPRGVSVLPVNCLGPCGKGPCGEAYAADPDPTRRPPTGLRDDDGFFDEGAAAPSPGVLPSGLVMARVAPGRERLANGFISTQIRTPADARVLFRGMGYDDAALRGGRGYGSRRRPAAEEVTSARGGVLDLNRLDNILVQRLCYAGLFVFFSNRFELDGGADIVLAAGLPAIPLWVLGLAFFGATQVISIDPDENTYRPPRADLDNPMPYPSDE